MLPEDALDYALGPEEYHSVHRRFHPQHLSRAYRYRAILYERNYYDIFFLDTAGNCIYSVYKELDYATNFLADGPGEWRNSGLGEAHFLEWEVSGVAQALVDLAQQALQSEVPSGREASSDEGTRPPAGGPSGSVSKVSTVRSLGSASAADLLCTLKINDEATDPGTILVQTLLCSVDHHVLLETSAYVTQPARDSARGFVELQQRLVDGIDLSCSVCEELLKDRGYSKQGFMDFLKKPDAAATAAPESQPCAAGVLAAMKGLWLGLRLSF
ncbi:hypothetical protein AK812_SmicGene6603 [Symbiodinium microadriaticum]|uniref:Uncharacterized protein n=1 Tax=Symbiodinium microadriaticum TaxID=2951 RepID=A0A1Q9EQP2_SYMMI|nr:hypothetical protein AK812_SmicGene6603 [Symbiodinium microadriaticum]CAE7255475.1 unnamed protein product [Symbiodinium sp. KB8]